MFNAFSYVSNFFKAAARTAIFSGQSQFTIQLQGHMIFEKQTPWRIPPRTSVAREADDGIALTRQQILQIAGALDSPGADVLVTARSAWVGYQSTRERDAVYGYLTAVFEIVSRWKQQRRAKAKSHHALAATKSPRALRTEDPFTVVICCTSDPCKVDTKTRSKWSRALRFSERFKPDTLSLAQFIKSKGGNNECAAQWSDRLR